MILEAANVFQLLKLQNSFQNKRCTQSRTNMFSQQQTAENSLDLVDIDHHLSLFSIFLLSTQLGLKREM